MPEPIALHRLLTTLPLRTLVAFDGERSVSGNQLLARIDAWYGLLPPAPGAIALNHSHALEFVAALYAAWLRDLDVIVAADRLPATVAQLAPRVLALVGEFDLAEAIQGPATSEGSTTDRQLASSVRELPRGPASRLILSTSGSTGEPLLVVKELHQLSAEVAALEQCFGATLGAARIAATVSHLHIYGLLFRLLWPLAGGRAFEARSHAYLETVAATRARPLALIASPAHLKRIPAGLDWQRGGVPLQALFSSGGPLPLEAAIAARDQIGVTPIEVYGSTETGGIGWRQQHQADTPFQVLPGVELAQADAEQIALRSAHLPDSNWTVLADRGELLAGGAVRLLGRTDRIVKIEEKRISLSAIEQAASQGAWLTEARAVVLEGPRPQIALVGVPNGAGRELLLHAGRRALSERVRAELGHSCERVALPRRLRFVGALPRNDQGKTSAASLQALFAEPESRPLLPFHDWVARDAERAQVELWIGPDLYHFQGHFPGQPILPGVAQVDWTITLARRAHALPPRLLRMEVLKFMAVITPGTRLLLDLHWQAARKVLEFRSHSAVGAHASARLVYA